MDKNQKPKTLAPRDLYDKNQGFTLLEVLTALSLAAGLFVLLLSLYSLSSKSLSAGQARAELTQNGRLLTDRLARELRQTKQIATVLPPDDSDPANPPKSEIEFQDGHDDDIIQYIRYFLEGSDIKRQLRRYYFPSEPNVFVLSGSRDQFGNPPQLSVVNDELVGQFAQSAQFFGRELVHIKIVLNKNNVRHEIKTAVYGRNL